jgi:DNA-binding response OmpR family regulator
MWILVVGKEASLGRPDGGVLTLRDLGCRVQTSDLWDRLDLPEIASDPPAAVLVEALDEVDAGRAALARLKSIEALANVPVLIAVTVEGMSRVDAGDSFDDFVLVPYVPAELYLRVRRAEWARSEFSGHERMKIGAIVIDLAAHEVMVDGRSIDLTHQEFALLRYLAQHRGRVFTRDQLLSRVWGVDYYGGSRTVDIHVRRLRMKLGAASKPIQTVRGVGYKMKAP